MQAVVQISRPHATAPRGRRRRPRFAAALLAAAAVAAVPSLVLQPLSFVMAPQGRSPVAASWRRADARSALQLEARSAVMREATARTSFAQPPAEVMSLLATEKSSSPFGFSMPWGNSAKGGYQVLMEENIPGSLDLSTLESELASDTWSDDTWLIKALLKDGAKGLTTSPWTGQSREIKFQTKIDIPWERIQEASRREGKADNTKALAAASNGDITGTCKVYQAASGHLIVQMSFMIPPPLPTLHIVLAVRPGAGKGFVFAGAVEFHDGGGVLDNGIVRYFMEMGFLNGAKRFGRSIFAELQQRARSARSISAGGARSSAARYRPGLERTSGGAARRAGRGLDAVGGKGSDEPSATTSSGVPQLLRSFWARARGAFRS